MGQKERVYDPHNPAVCLEQARKVDARLPGKVISKSHGARPVHRIITMMKWIWSSRLSIEKSFSGESPDTMHLETSLASTPLHTRRNNPTAERELFKDRARSPESRSIRGGSEGHFNQERD